jgi:peptidyl-prolyl cis-trans isomerase SurA
LLEDSLNVFGSFRVWLSLLLSALTAVLLGVLAGCPRSAPEKDVVATISGKKIMRSELEKYFQNQTAGAPQPPSGEQATSLRLSILKELIDDEIMLQQAEKLGLMATDEEVDGKVNELKAPYTQEEFDKHLKEKSLTLDDLKREIRRTLTIEKVVNKEITSKITITDGDITNYFNQHKAEFNLVEPQYHLARIMVTTVPNAQVHNLKNDKAQNEAQAKAKIQEIQNRLESGEDFAQVAMNYSEDPDTSGNGGDMGFVPESTLKGSDASIREAVAKLSVGHISGIIPLLNPNRQAGAYMIVKLLSRETAGQRDLNDPRVQQNIREQLRQTREQLLRGAYYEVIRNDAKVKNYFAEDVLKNMDQK